MKRLLALASLGIASAFGVDSTLLNLVSPNVMAVGGMYVDRTVNSPFGQFLLTQLNDDEPAFQKFVSTTGFDPRRDLREIVFASLTGATGPKADGLVVARGVFNGPLLFSAAQAEGGVVTRYGGVDTLQFKGKTGALLAVLDGSILVAGTDSLVKTAIDRRTGGAALNAGLLAKVQDVSSRYDAWVVSIAPIRQLTGAASTKQTRKAMGSAALQAIDQVSGGVRFGNLVQVDGEAVTRSEKDAQALADVIRFLVSMMQMGSNRTPEVAKFADLLQTMEIKTSANLVQIGFSIPQSEIEDLFRLKAQVKQASDRQ